MTSGRRALGSMKRRAMGACVEVAPRSSIGTSRPARPLRGAEAGSRGIIEVSSSRSSSASSPCSPHPRSCARISRAGSSRPHISSQRGDSRRNGAKLARAEQAAEAGGLNGQHARDRREEEGGAESAAQVRRRDLAQVHGHDDGRTSACEAGEDARAEQQHQTTHARLGRAHVAARGEERGRSAERGRAQVEARVAEQELPATPRVGERAGGKRA
eukprot:scaffold141176_cov27-Tisochrysis_lutea.AAC.2